MNLQPLLDNWQPPSGAGNPIGLIATTFTLDPDFFERDCLARFLSVESIDEGSGSVDDLVARLELEESLRAPAITVLADRSAQGERSTLLWDVLHCQVPQQGLLHAKVAILLWEHATRVIIGSANLTPAGYRHQIELALAADLGKDCLLPNDVLVSLADEVQSYLELVPGLTPDIPAHQQATNTLELFRQRVAAQSTTKAQLRASFAPTNSQTGPLDTFEDAWRGTRPLRAIHLSPFWDEHDTTVLTGIAGLLTGQPKRDRRHQVAVVIDPRGKIAFPPEHFNLVDSVNQLRSLDEEVRRLHAKCLLLSQDDWVAALVGSSNHTVPGFGLRGATGRRHREINIWLGAPRKSKVGKALLSLIRLGEEIAPDDAELDDLGDEDETDEGAPALPTGFGLCRIVHGDDSWLLKLELDPKSLPKQWRIRLPNEQMILDNRSWTSAGSPSSTVVSLPDEELPLFTIVEWDNTSTIWAVLADDRHSLPFGPGLPDLRSKHLLAALSSGKPLSQVIREELIRTSAEHSTIPTAVSLDPLKIHDSKSILLRKGRELARSLSAMQRRLEQPVLTLDALRARLSGPLGPEFVSIKTLEDAKAQTITVPEGIFTLAEIALTVGRVDWSKALKYVDEQAGMALVMDTLEEIRSLNSQLTDGPTDLTEYAARALKEARQCLTP